MLHEMLDNVLEPCAKALAPWLTKRTGLDCRPAGWLCSTRHAERSGSRSSMGAGVPFASDSGIASPNWLRPVRLVQTIRFFDPAPSSNRISGRMLLRVATVFVAIFATRLPFKSLMLRMGSRANNS
jgi:hypothetical protein